MIQSTLQGNIDSKTIGHLAKIARFACYSPLPENKINESRYEDVTLRALCMDPQNIEIPGEVYDRIWFNLTGLFGVICGFVESPLSGQLESDAIRLLDETAVPYEEAAILLAACYIRLCTIHNAELPGEERVPEILMILTLLCMRLSGHDVAAISDYIVLCVGTSSSKWLSDRLVLEVLFCLQCCRSQSRDVASQYISNMYRAMYYDREGEMLSERYIIGIADAAVNIIGRLGSTGRQ